MSQETSEPKQCQVTCNACGNHPLVTITAEDKVPLVNVRCPGCGTLLNFSNPYFDHQSDGLDRIVVCGVCLREKTITYTPETPFNEVCPHCLFPINFSEVIKDEVEPRWVSFAEEWGFVWFIGCIGITFCCIVWFAHHCATSSPSPRQTRPETYQESLDRRADERQKENEKAMMDAIEDAEIEYRREQRYDR